MRTKIAILLVLLLILPIASNVSVVKENKENEMAEITEENNFSVNIQQYTHTVLAELGSTTWCPYCPGASETMSKVFSNASVPFYYITLVYDQSEAAKKRGMEFNDFYIPMLYIDGGYSVVDTVSEISYYNAIEEAATREVHDVDMDIEATWNGNNIAISLSIYNGDTTPYLGHLRICIVEIDSRWIDNAGKHYNYTLMDYALNKYVFIGGGKAKNLQIEWENTYGMEEGNTMVLAYIAHWLPKIQKNPWDDPKPTRFLAQFVDEVCAVEI